MHNVQVISPSVAVATGCSGGADVSRLGTVDAATDPRGYPWDQVR